MTNIRTILLAIWRTVLGNGPTLLLCFAFLLLCVAHKALGAESAGISELKRIQHELSDKAEALKATDLQSYSLLTNAIKDLKKYTEDGDADGSRLMVQLLSPQNLKRLFKAPTHIDKKTGEISIGYDWSDATQIQDWTVGAAVPVIKKGALDIAALDKLTHKAQWNGAVTISGRLSMQNRLGTHLTASNGYSIVGATYNAWIVQIHKAGVRVAEDTFDHSGSDSEPGQFIPFSWSIQNDRTTLKFLKSAAGTQTSEPFNGQVGLCGGQGGDSYASGLILTGTLDLNWVKQQLGVGAP